MNNRVERGLIAVVLIPLGLLLLVVAALSLRWRMALDAPVMMYMAYLIDQLHYVPYRDFFDVNMPAAFLVYRFVGRCFGYGDLGVRVVDLLFLGATSLTTWFWMRRISARAAWASVILFGWMYLKFGPRINLERELVFLPLLGGALLAASGSGLHLRLRAGVVGLLLGCAAAIKPPWALVLVPILWFMKSETTGGREPERGRGFTRTLVWCIAGFAIPLAATFAYLLWKGTLGPFLEMATEYWPLYAQLTVGHGVVSGAARVAYMAHHWVRFGNHLVWFAPAAVGTVVALCCGRLDPARRRQVVLMIGLAVCSSLFPLFSGQFWFYHWLPFLYSIVLLSSLCLAPRAGEAPRGLRLIPVLVLLVAVVLAVRPPQEFYAQISGRPIEPPHHGRVDEIAEHLRSRMEPGDLVQPLDWGRGVAHAMLIAGAEPATSFVYDLPFYHHTPHAYIQGLRRRFLEEFRESRPRFIVESYKPWMLGLWGSYQFGSLRDVLATEYTIIAERREYVIFERLRQEPPD